MKKDKTLKKDDPKKSKENFKEEKNCKLCQTPEVKNLKELPSKFKDDLRSEDSYDFNKSQSCCD